MHTYTYMRTQTDAGHYVRMERMEISKHYTIIYKRFEKQVREL